MISCHVILFVRYVLLSFCDSRLAAIICINLHIVLLILRKPSLIINICVRGMLDTRD